MAGINPSGGTIFCRVPFYVDVPTALVLGLDCSRGEFVVAELVLYLSLPSTAPGSKLRGSVNDSELHALVDMPEFIRTRAREVLDDLEEECRQHKDKRDATVAARPKLHIVETPPSPEDAGV
jgi:hypothetical protein